MSSTLPPAWIEDLLRAASAYAKGDDPAACEALLERCLAGHSAVEESGSVSVEVQAEALLHGGQPLAADLGSVLAQRLHGDGLRQLILTGIARPEDLVDLIEVLALRLLDPPEDDVSSLAAARISPRIIFEGSSSPFPPSEGNEHAPREWDLPHPRRGAAEPVGPRALSQDKLRALHREASSLTREGAVQITREALQHAGDSPAAQERCIAILAALARQLLAGAHFRELVYLLERSKRVLPTLGALASIDALVTQGTVIDHVVDAHGEVRGDDMAALLGYAGNGLADALLIRFSAEGQSARRQRLKNAIIALATSRPDVILDRLGDLGSSDRAAELFNVICIAAPPERLMDAAYGLLDEGEADLQLAALEVIAADSAGPRLEGACTQLLESDSSAVRQRAAGILGRKGGEGAVESLLGAAERLAGARLLDDSEATHFGRALGAASGTKTPATLLKWVKPPSLLTRGKRARVARQLRWTAVAALAKVATKEAQAAIAVATERADAALQAHCAGALQRAELAAKQRQEDLERTRPLRAMDDVPEDLERSGRFYGSARRPPTLGDDDE